MSSLCIFEYFCEPIESMNSYIVIAGGYDLGIFKVNEYCLILSPNPAMTLTLKKEH